MEEEGNFRKAPDGRKLIFFNGPPLCGKTLGANAVMSFVRSNAPWMQPVFIDMAEPLKKGAHALYTAFHSWDYYDSKDGIAAKGLACGDFLGQSPREVYIEMFKFLEQRHGPEVLGFLARKRIISRADGRVFVSPNIGRIADLEPLVNTFGQRNLLIIEVHMADRTFDQDIRGYIADAAKEKWPHINTKKLPNVYGTQEDKDFFKFLCGGAVKNFLKVEEKEFG